MKRTISNSQTRKYIQKQRKSKKSLLESEARYRGMVETAAAGISLNELVYDESGEAVDYRILEANPAFYEMADYVGPVVGNVATNL